MTEDITRRNGIIKQLKGVRRKAWDAGENEAAEKATFLIEELESINLGE